MFAATANPDAADDHVEVDDTDAGDRQRVVDVGKRERTKSGAGNRPDADEGLDVDEDRPQAVVDLWAPAGLLHAARLTVREVMIVVLTV